MKCLVYSSTASLDFDSETLQELQKAAVLANSKVDTTGFLFFRNKTFLQYIEGDETHIDQLIANLAADSRHQIHFSHHATTDHRRFPDWHMQWITPEDEIQLNLESLVHTYLRALKDVSKPDGEDRLQEVIWRLINALAEIRANTDDPRSTPP